MKRSTRAEKAQQTLTIIDQGFYETGVQKINIKDKIEDAVLNTMLYRNDEFNAMMIEVDTRLKVLNYDTLIKAENVTVLQAAYELTKNKGRTGCLNFASAKNPGGGFLGGAMAQEESLALSSALYPTLMKHFEMYEYNRGKSTYLYSDYMIYSPDVVVFRDDEGVLISDPYPLSFVTSPAVNIGAMKTNRPEEMLLAEETMLRRMDKVLGLFVHHRIEHVLLGAWGCGVFQNNPEDIARYFAGFLLNGGKYSRSFKSVLFAVFDRSRDQHNIKAFQEYFK
jgi:uncharacterized protein (TIGR02452 family)